MTVYRQDIFSSHSTHSKKRFEGPLSPQAYKLRAVGPPNSRSLLANKPPKNFISNGG